VIRRAVAFALVAVAGLVSTLTLAQTKPPAAHHAPAPHHPKPKGPGDAGASPPPESLPVPSRGESESHIDAGAVSSKTLDGGTRVFRFGEVEIEGRLRNPQLVYFLRRVRAEFAAGDLGHRSFMRELSDTRHDPSF
jgi:hypothetical protein